MPKPFVTVILAGGKGSRMGSSDKHKVCFEVLGIPVIIRALETYNVSGSSLNVVVAGMMAEKVMSTIGQRFQGTVFAYQEQPLGTGNAAKKAADILERMRFHGDVLVVAGDKAIEPRVIRRLLELHAKAEADVTLATVRRAPGSSEGIILSEPGGNIVGILEDWEVKRLQLVADLAARFARRRRLPSALICEQLLAAMPEKKVRQYLGALWELAEAGASVARPAFEALFTPEERRGVVRVGDREWPAAEIHDAFPQANLSVYLFKAAALYDALHKLKPSRAGQEEYFTDAIQILAARTPPARIVSVEIQDAHDVMAFNNPDELLAIEEYVRSKEHKPIEVRTSGDGPALAPLEHWRAMLAHPSAEAKARFRQWYGSDVPWRQYLTALDGYARRYGTKDEVALIRSPGRINLLGRHIDHQGGSVNVMAINREIILVTSPRQDDTVALANADQSVFADHGFRISDVVSQLDWDDWQHAIDGPRVRRLLDEARGSWENYVKAAILRFQDQFREQRLRGMNMLVQGDIPMGAGLSSSSALVVATAEATAMFNHLPVTARGLVSLCGEGEWFVGTRGGAADHAAIKLSRRGYVTQVGFQPFQVENSAPFFKDHVLLVCNSGIYAGKSAKARHTFNQKVTAYHIGRTYFKLIRPELAPKIQHLRDVTPEHLDISRTLYYQSLSQLPVHMTRDEVRSTFAQLADAERESIERLFATHDEPGKGYPVRDVVMFGLGEMARARKCLALLKAGDAAGLGRLMNVSHDGDRVSRRGAGNQWQRIPVTLPDSYFREMAARKGAAGDIANCAGAYACSLPELDRVADLLLDQPGVKGAQMAGAGLGGCVMALVEKAHVAAAAATMVGYGVKADIFTPIAGACNLALV